jgi:FKBP-type peptidyl-prolyl cis-trans isomerase
MFIRCGQKTPAKSAQVSVEANEERIKNQFMGANRQLLQKENDEMDYYGKTHHMNFTRTSSGVRYFVYSPSQKGDSIREKMMVSMEYTVSLLDGTTVYSSAEKGKRTFKVGEEDIESGLHKGIQYLKKGDKAVLLIPSPLAHGLLGDMNKIPPQMPIIYDIIIDN